MPTPRLISSHWPFWLWDRQHILAPVMEDEHTTTVASSSDVSFVYPRSLSRATSVEPRNHHETRVSRLWTSSTSAARDSTTASIRRASMSRLYWLFSLQSGRSPQEAHRNADVRQLLLLRWKIMMANAKNKGQRGGGAEDSVIAPAPQLHFIHCTNRIKIESKSP